MSFKERKPKRQARRPLFGEHSWWQLLWDKVKHGIGRVTSSALSVDDREPTEPIDFSTPSIPYYIHLADKFHLARIVLYMVLFAFLVVTVLSSRQVITYENLYYLVKDIDAAGVSAASQADGLHYPHSQSRPDFDLFRGGLVVAGGDEVIALSGSGKQTLSDNVSMTSPGVSAGEQYFIVYSRGEKNFTVYNAFARMHKELTEYPVYDACMGNDGSFGVLSRSMDYTSEVTWYSSKMKPLAACHMGGYVVDMAMSEDSRTMAVLSMDSVGGGYESKLILLRRDGGGNVTYKEESFGGGCLGAYFLTDDRLCVITEDGFCVYRLDGSVQSRETLAGEKMLLWGADQGYFGVLCQNKAQLSEKTVKVFDKNGKLVYNVEVGSMENPATLAMDGSDVYIHDTARVLRVSNSGRRLSVATVGSNTLTVLPDGRGEVLVLSPAYARYLSQNDFTEIS